jgi:hypothetical protein
VKKVVFLLLVSFYSFSQTGIGTTTPNASAKLEVFATDKGFLPPRVALTATNATGPITSPANGLLVYNTATAGTSPNNVIPGFYYYNSSSWVRLIGPTDNASNVTGTVAIANGGTGTSTGSITGSGALTFAAGGTNQNVTLTPSGTGNTILNNNVGIGTTSPGDKLVVGSSIALHDGGDKVIGMGWSPGSGNAIFTGNPAEIRLNPGLGKLSFGTDPTSRTAGSSASVVKRMTITAQGSVGIGTESPGATLEIGSSDGSVTGNLILNPTTTGTGVEGAEIDFRPAPVTTSPAAQTWVIDQVSDANNPRFRFFPGGLGETKGFSIRDNGNLGIGTASANNKLHVQSTDGTSVYIESTTADNNGMLVLNANTTQNWSNDWHEFMFFQKRGTSLGYIGSTSNGSSIIYGANSDYRLKNDLKNYNGLELIDKIKTYDFAWKENGSRMHGVMAHELQEVVPYAVSGTKDETNSDGSPKIQTVDYSKLTPILVKAIQEQEKKINHLMKVNKSLIRRITQIEKSPRSK